MSIFFFCHREFSSVCQKIRNYFSVKKKKRGAGRRILLFTLNQQFRNRLLLVSRAGSSTKWQMELVRFSHQVQCLDTLSCESFDHLKKISSAKIANIRSRISRHQCSSSLSPLDRWRNWGRESVCKSAEGKQESSIPTSQSRSLWNTMDGLALQKTYHGSS